MFKWFDLSTPLSKVFLDIDVTHIIYRTSYKGLVTRDREGCLNDTGQTPMEGLAVVPHDV